MSKNDYRLLRPFDLEAAKRGEKIVDICGGGLAYIDGPDASGSHVVRIDGHFVLGSSERLRMAPLAWVEGKPVYRGDVLYDKEYGTRQAVRHAGSHGTLETDQPRRDGAHMICLEDATWTPPKVKREDFVIVARNRTVSREVAEQMLSNIKHSGELVLARAEWEE